ncbi:hypothetical protein [Qipengyuania sp.]|uniref:hypothetical protein n=1 Tax=Qipengyuania sp. TaxID=2004515 RepID=UPI0035199F20
MGRSPDDSARQVKAKLTAEMASFRLLVLTFIRDYWNDVGASPSYGEIAAGLDSNRDRVRKAVKSLNRDGLVLRTPGPRGIKLPSVLEESVRQLRELGWRVDEDLQEARAPVTNSPLLPPAALTYPSRDGTEGQKRDRG